MFPDRFANGDPANDVADDAWTYRGQPTRHRPWGELPDRGPGPVGGVLRRRPARASRRRLDHLVDLGVNALYLNPVFESRSNHGYDTIDYDHVAAHLGGDAALVSLRRATLERGIRLVLDIAPNHTGVEHPWFVAAQADPAAPTAGYFTFRRRPDDYASWLGVKSLPKLDYRDAGPARRDVRRPRRDPAPLARAAVLDRRLADRRREHARPPGSGPARARRRARDARGGEGDEPRRLPDGRALLRRDGLAQRRPVGRGDELRGVHDARPVLVHGRAAPAPDGPRWSGTRPLTTTELVAALAAFRAAVPWAVARCQYDLLGSHDTARIRTRLGGDPGRVRAAFGLLLGYVGVPGFLYGDEVGLEGANDDAARRTMPWDEADWDLEQLAFTRTLVRLRTGPRRSSAGGFQVLEAGDGLAGVPARHGRRAGDRRRRARPGARAGRRACRVAHGAVADGTAFV